jgi:hypothetical protein
LRRSIVLRRWTNDGLRSATGSNGARSSVGVLSQVVMIQPSARRPRGAVAAMESFLQPAAACPRPSRVRRPKQLRIPIVRSSNGPIPPLTPHTREIDPHRKQGHHDDTAGQAAKRISHLFLQHTPTTQCSFIINRTACRFSNPVSRRDLLPCDDASCLTRCHRVLVSNSCQFFRLRYLAATDASACPLCCRVVAGTFRHCDIWAIHSLLGQPCLWSHRESSGSSMKARAAFLLTKVAAPEASCLRGSAGRLRSTV